MTQQYEVRNCPICDVPQGYVCDMVPCPQKEEVPEEKQEPKETEE